MKHFIYFRVKHTNQYFYEKIGDHSTVHFGKGL